MRRCHSLALLGGGLLARPAGARPADVELMLEAHALSIGYGKRIVASGIDVTVGRGEVLCLLGPNGAGKTTLFKTLLGLILAKAGEVRLGDHPIEDLSHTEMARGIAYVPQAQVMEFAYSVLDLVLMGRTAHLGPFAGPPISARSPDRPSRPVRRTARRRP